MNELFFPPAHLEVVDILRSTLARLEESPDVAHDDPAFVELKHTIVRALAELEMHKNQKLPAA
jgi:hypothetical protein